MDVVGGQCDFSVFTDSGRPGPTPQHTASPVDAGGHGMEGMELHSGLVFWLNQPKLT